MKILICGAGVIGSVYAGHLAQAGEDVTLLARGPRAVSLRTHGIALQDAATGLIARMTIPVVDELAADARYDLVIVTVRREQVDSVTPALARALQVRTVLFMHNHASSSQPLVDTVGQSRVLLGFPGVAGTLKGPLVRYVRIEQQPTTLGEPDGQISPRLEQIAHTFRAAGFPVALCRHMDAWLITHAVFVTAVAGALYGAGTDSVTLSRTPGAVEDFVHAVREGFRALAALSFAPPPLNLRAIFEWLPQWIGVRYWRRLFASPSGDLYFAQHARAAPEEMKALADEIRTVLRRGPMSTPTLTRLYQCIDARNNVGAPHV